MKKMIMFILLIAIQSIVISALYASAIYENANQSAEFMRTLSRNAAIGIDGVFYNPAGLAMIEKNGLYLYFSNQFIRQNTKITDSSPFLSYYLGGGQEVLFKGKVGTAIFPDVHLVYKQDNKVLFFSVCPIGENSTITYGQGLPSLHAIAINYAASIVTQAEPALARYKADVYAKGQGGFWGFTFGGAYAINKIFSVGLGFRILREFENSSTNIIFREAIGSLSAMNYVTIQPNLFQDTRIKSEGNGTGMGLLAGFDAKPSDKLNIGMRWEYYSGLEVTTKVKELEAPVYLKPFFASIYQDGAKTKKTFPMVTAFGVSYKVRPNLMVETDLAYYFNKLTDWNGFEKKFNNGYDASIAVEYTVTPALKASFGSSYTPSGRTSQSRDEVNTGLTDKTIAMGATYSLSNRIDVTLAAVHVFSKAAEIASPAGGMQTLKDSTWVAAIGVAYKIK